MKKLILLLLLLIPLFNNAQVKITSSNDNINIRLDTVDIEKPISIKLFDINGKLILDTKSAYTDYSVDRDTSDFKVIDITKQSGIYIIIIEYSKDIIKKLIYLK